MAKHMSYVDCCDDPNIFGPWFGGDSWNTWRAIDKAIFGLKLTAEELATFTSITGLSEAPSQPCKEAWLILGAAAARTLRPRHMPPISLPLAPRPMAGAAS